MARENAPSPKPGRQFLARNRKALHDFEVLEKIEAGIQLVGTEVKVVRDGKAGLAGAFAHIDKRTNEAFLDKHGFTSRIHRKKPKGRLMPAATRRANNAKSKIRSRVEHVFAEQKVRMGLFVRTIGIARAKTKIGMANLVYNMRRLVWLTQVAPA